MGKQRKFGGFERKANKIRHGSLLTGIERRFGGGGKIKKKAIA